MENFADLYSDYLISSSSYTTATGMASLLSIKHDKITYELSKGDSWYSSIENMIYAKKELGADFIPVLKSNSKVALSLGTKEKKEYVSIETLQPGQSRTCGMEVWFEELDFPLLLTKHPV